MVENYHYNRPYDPAIPFQVHTWRNVYISGAVYSDGHSNDTHIDKTSTQLSTHDRIHGAGMYTK